MIFTEIIIHYFALSEGAIAYEIFDKKKDVWYNGHTLCFPINHHFESRKIRGLIERCAFEKSIPHTVQQGEHHTQSNLYYTVSV